MDQEETRSVTQIVGANMRRVRETNAKVLYDVAAAARDLGLTWDASAVSRIETGKRDLTLEEFLALPLVLTLALNEIVSLVDLLEMNDEQALNIKSFNQDTFVIPLFAMLAEPWFASPFKADGNIVRDTIREHLQTKKIKAQIAREPDEERSLLRELRAIAEDLGVKPGEVMDACKALWGEHTILPADERERRLRDSGADLSSPTTVRTLRGHISRQLMAELRDYFAARKHTDRPTGDE
jgi:hypothetical protein